MLLDNKPLLLSISTFVVLLLLFLAVSSVLSARRRQRQIIVRARKWSGDGKAEVAVDSGASSEAPKKQSGRLRLPGMRKKAGNSGIYANTPLFYQRAGIYDPMSIRFYQGLRYTLLLLPAAYPLSIHFLYGRPASILMMAVVFLIGYLGYYLPVLWLKVAAGYRKKELDRTFPDALDLLMICIEAGMGIDMAIRRVSREIHITSPELAKELKILSLELKTGMPRNTCLKNLAQRANLPDVDNLVSLMIQAEKYGTGVAHALRIHAEEMRQKRYSKLEEMAAKLPVKLVIPLILFIFPAFFVVIAGPAAIQVLRIIIQG